MTTNNACEKNIEKNEQAATEQIKTKIGGSVDFGCIMHVYYEEMQAKVQQWKSCALRKNTKLSLGRCLFKKVLICTFKVAY